MASFIDVKVSDEIVKLFSEMQLKKDKQYIILKLSKKMDAVEVHCSGGKVDLAQDQKAAFDEFKVLLDNTECRFAIYDFRFSVAAGERQKLIFIAWSPQDCNRTQRMVYTSCKESVKRKFPAIALDVQACDDDDLSYESILEKAQRHVK